MVFHVRSTPGFNSTGTHIRCFGALLTLGNFVLNLLAVIQRPESLRRDVRVMDKQILTAIVGNDKTITLPLIKPFYFTFIHNVLLRLFF